MNPAAVLRVMVKADGIDKTSGDLKGLDRDLAKAGVIADQATRKIEQFGRLDEQARASLKIDGATAELEVLQRKLTALTAKDPTVEVRVEIAKTLIDLERVDARKRALENGAAEIKVVADTSNAQSAFDRLTAKAGILQRTIALVKPAALIAGLGFVAQAASAAAAGGTALVSALGPLVGVFGAGAVAASAYQQAMGVAKLATLGLKDAMSPLADGLKKPTPALIAFGKEVSSMLLPNLRHLRNLAQSNLLPGVESAIRSAAGAFAFLDPVVAATGKVLGGLARQAGALVGSGGFGRDLQTIGLRNASILEILGTAAINVGDALRHVLVAAGPLTTWMAKLIGTWAKGAQQAAATGRESGKMAAFFESTRAVIARLLSIAGSLAVAFGNVARAGKGLGNDILASMDKGAASMARWTKSASGQNAIKDFFANAKGPIYEVGRLIRDVAVGFGKLSQQPGLENLIKQFRTQLLPVLLRVLNSTTKAFGPPLIAMISAVAKAFEPLAGSSGPLVLYVKVITKLAEAASWVMKNVPGAATAVTALVGAFAVSKAIGFAGSITGVTKVIGLMRTGALTGAGAMNTWTLSVIRAQVAAALAKVVRGLVTAFWLLNAAMVANPFVLIVVAVVALVAALVYAYKHSETFRSIVDGAFKAVASAAQWMWGAIQTVFNAIVSVIKWAWEQILPNTEFTWANIKAVLFAAWETIKSSVVTAWNFVRDNIIRPVAEAAVWLYNAGVTIGTFLAARWENIKTVATTAWNAVKNNIINPIRNAAVWLYTAVGNVARWLGEKWNTIRGAAQTAWNAVKTNVVNPVREAIGSVKTTIGDVVGWLGEKWTTIKNKAQEGWDKVKDAIIKPIGAALTAIRTKIGDFLQIGKDIVGGIADGIVAAGKAVLNKLRDVVNNAKKGVKKLLGISSPSKVFAEYGRNISAGLAVGIDQGAVRAAQAAARMAAGATAVMPSSIQVGMDANQGAIVAGARPGSSPGDGSMSSAVPSIHIYLGDREITDIVKVEIEQNGEKTALAYRAGTIAP